MTVAGKLLLIGTPLGNLADISSRALEALKSCDLLLCEDTRHSGKLLHHYLIDVKLESFHEHNERGKGEEIIQRIREGETIGIISDAGMPLLSDPGFDLVRRVREEGLIVEPIPGPFAGALALVSSGIAPVPFAFHGFTPHKSSERRDFYRDVASKEMTAVVYESPMRIVESLRDALEVLGDVPMTLAREMTKLHEEFIHGTISEVLGRVEDRDQVRGEITLVFAAAAGRQAEEVDIEKLRSEFQRLRDDGFKRNDAIKMLAERYGVKKNELYRMLL